MVGAVAVEMVGREVGRARRRGSGGRAGGGRKRSRANPTSRTTAQLQWLWVHTIPHLARLQAMQARSRAVVAARIAGVSAG